MKMVIAILNHDDADNVAAALSAKGYPSTRTEAVGGFLKKRNDLLLVGIEDIQVERVVGIIGENSHSRAQAVPETEGLAGLLQSKPKQVDVGGAVVFVLDIDRYYKL
jgi:uncharacterized protein YaaQ